MKRHKTTYPGVFYREAVRTGGKGMERVYYIVFKRGGKFFEEKAGRQYADDMTPARAAMIRGERLEGKRQSRKEIRAAAGVVSWTVARLWDEYVSRQPVNAIRADRGRFKNYLAQTLGTRKPKDIVQLDVDRLRIQLLKTKAPQTVAHVLNLLKRLIHFGENKGLCSALVFKIEMPKVDNIQTEDLTPEQLDNLLAAINEDHDYHAAAMMKLALFTGMRRGELFKLQWDDLDFDRGFIHIRHDPKGGKDQAIPMNQTAREILEGHPKDESTPLVFPGRHGRRRTAISQPVNRIKARAGLPADFRPLHGLRHTFASHLASSGVDLYVLQRLLTHKDPSMTQRYAHLRDDALRRASDLAGNIAQAMNGKQAQVIAEGRKK